MTYLVEMVSLVFKTYSFSHSNLDQKSLPAFAHYCQFFSGVCCAKHYWQLYTFAFFSPLFQQITISFYANCMEKYYSFWTNEKSEVRDCAKKENPGKDCGKCCKESETVCVFCDYNLDEFKLKQLMKNSLDIRYFGQEILAFTENLYMPMVQLTFLFPIFVKWLSVDDPVEIHTEEKNPIKYYINIIFDNWTAILILLSVISSIISLTKSQTNVYFSPPEKRNDKTTKNQFMMFIVILLQVMVKVFTFQVFAFGLRRRFDLGDVSFFVLVTFLPLLSQVWKGLVIRMVFAFKKCYEGQFIKTCKEKFCCPKLKLDEGILKVVCFFHELLSPSPFILLCKTSGGDFKIGLYTIFNILSLIENVGLTYIGEKCLLETEKCFDHHNLTFIVFIVQFTGLVIHQVYFYLHPMMKLTKIAYNMLEGFLMFISAMLFIGAMIYLWHYYMTYTDDVNDPDLCLNYWKNITLETFSNYTTDVHLMTPSKVKGRKITTSIIALTVFTVLVGLFVSTYT